MKISEKQKKANRKNILTTAIDLMGEEGIDRVSMRRVAKEAGIAEATIYNYFPTKERLLTSAFVDMADQVVETLKKVDGWERFTFAEQTQTLIQTWLDRMALDRSFVTEAFPRIFLRPSAIMPDALEVRERYMAMAGDILSAAVEVEELPATADSELIRALQWDYFVGVVSYWLRDRSDGFDNTIQLVDKATRLAESVLKTRILEHGMELVTFLFRSHVVAPFESASRLFDASPLKRMFFEGKGV